MKQLIVVLLFLLLFCSQSHALVKTYNLAFNNTDFIYNTNNGLTYIDSSKGISFASDTLKPMLPQLGVYVLLSPDEDVDDFSFSFGNPYFQQNIRMPACELDVPSIESDSAHNSLTREIEHGEFLPFVEYCGITVMDGYHIACFLVSPFAFNADTNVLTLNHDLQIQINIKNTNNNITLLPQRGNDLKHKAITGMLVNPQELSSLYQTELQIEESNDNANIESTPIEYLIITNNAMKSTFQKLADWKTQKGIKTKVITTEDIILTYSHPATQSRIKHAITDYWENGNHRLNYVLLGGGESIIPSQKCKVMYDQTIINKYSEDYTESDIYYSCLNDLYWNVNMDIPWTDLRNDIDIFPNVILTRLLVNDSVEADIVINRIIDYERQKNNKSINKNILMAGAEVQFSNNTPSGPPTYGRRQSDSEIHCNTIWNVISNLWDGTRFRLFDTWTDYDDGASHELNSSTLNAELEKGYTFVEMETHGFNTSWKLENGSYPSSFASSINNPSSSIITTSACYTNHFAEIECLSHSFLVNPKSGVLGYYGASITGWSSVGPKFDEEFYRSILLDEYHRFGKAAYDTKMAFATEKASINFGHKWLHFTINPIGDPEMPIFIDTPKYFLDSIFKYRNGSLTINPECDSYNVCVMSLEDKGESYYHAANNIYGTQTFSNLDGNYSVCVTAPGYVPKVIRIIGTGYVQNEIESDDILMLSDSLDIGSQVTQEKDYGPVEFRGGNMRIKSPDGVTIHGTTTIPRGTNVEIRTKE